MAKNRTKARRLMTVEIDISPKMTPAQVHAVFIIVPRFNITTLITMIEAMRIANYLAPAPIFSWEIASFDGKKISGRPAFEHLYAFFALVQTS